MESTAVETIVRIPVNKLAIPPNVRKKQETDIEELAALIAFAFPSEECRLIQLAVLATSQLPAVLLPYVLAPHPGKTM